jgi:ABC-type phosphate transport system substrate-binding protein
VSKRRLILLVVVVAAAGVLTASDSRATGVAAWRVIVNPANSTTSIDRRFLADLFLKKITRWPSGDAARPVDQRGEAPVRLRFSEDVFARSVASIKSYWAQLVFSGRDVPPPELDGDEDVVRFVLKNVGAVGYVSPGAALDRAKTLSVK